MANYFDHFLSLDMPTYTVAQTAMCFEPSTVLWVFHTIQPSSSALQLHMQCIMIFLIVFASKGMLNV